VAAALILAALVSHHARAQQSEREAAVRLARTGHVEEAIARLRAMVAAGTSDRFAALDLAVLLQEAGRPAEAIAVWERARAVDPPSYALLAIVRAYRDARQFERAAELARAGLRRFPAEPVWPILLALVLADAGHGDEALAVLASPAARRAPEAERLLAGGYAAQRANRPFEALRNYAAVAHRDPANREAREATQAILRGMRAPWAAARFASEPPPLPLAAEMTAAEVRWGAQDTPYDPRRRFEGTDPAIANLDRLIAAAEAADNTALATSLRLDRMVALRDRVRMAEVVAEANALRQAGVTIPPYATEALADALLYLRQPEAARAAYEDVLAADPNTPNARAGRFYATLEMEDLSEAIGQADAQLAAEPVWQRYVDDPTLYPRDQYLEAALRAALVRVYTDQPAAAWERIQPIRDAAPASAAVRLAAGEVMAARGWPRAAEEENRIALSLAPDQAGAQIAVADSALARNRFAEAATRIAALADIYPENLAVQRLRRELAAQTGWILDATVGPSQETGGGANNSGFEITAGVRIASPLIANRWRIFALSSYANANPPEGFVQRVRVGGGFQLVLPDLTAALSFHQDLGSLERAGFDATLDWRPSDVLDLGASYQRISDETPLRALLQGITADSLNLAASWSWDESHRLALAAIWMPFTDGNERVSLDLRYTQKLLQRPRFALTAEGELYGSANRLTDVPYYSPRADFSATVGLLVEHTLWRRYEHSFAHALNVSGGVYAERGFAVGPIGTVAYEHRWQFDPWTALSYGVSLAEHRYDGAGAHTIAGFVTLRQRF
jgi:biofilm PGA synthesis protein PgaA